MGNYERFMERSTMLCNAWESALLMMTRLPGTNSKNAKKTLKDFYADVRIGMRKWFNSSVYEGTIKATNYSKADSKPPNQGSLCNQNYPTPIIILNCKNRAVHYLSRVNRNSNKKEMYQLQIKLLRFSSSEPIILPYFSDDVIRCDPVLCHCY